MEDGVCAVCGHCDLEFIMRVPLLETSSLVLQVYNGSVGSLLAFRQARDLCCPNWGGKLGKQGGAATEWSHNPAPSASLLPEPRSITIISSHFLKAL